MYRIGYTLKTMNHRSAANQRFIDRSGKMKKKKTRKIRIGNVPVGGGGPVIVQSMLKTNPENVQETLDQARALKKAGCELIRIALPQEETCKIIPFFKKEINVPLIGDIHFNHKIALKAMELGIDAIRINPEHDPRLV